MHKKLNNWKNLYKTFVQIFVEYMVQIYDFLENTNHQN